MSDSPENIPASVSPPGKGSAVPISTVPSLTGPSSAGIPARSDLPPSVNAKGMSILDSRILVSQTKYSIPFLATTINSAQALTQYGGVSPTPLPTKPFTVLGQKLPLQELDQKHLMSDVQVPQGMRVAYTVCRIGGNAFKFASFLEAGMEVSAGKTEGAFSLLGAIAGGRLSSAAATTGTRMMLTELAFDGAAAVATKNPYIKAVVVASWFFAGGLGAKGGGEALGMVGHTIDKAMDGHSYERIRPQSTLPFREDQPHIAILPTPHGVNRAFVMDGKGYGETLDHWLGKHPDTHIALPPVKQAVQHPDWAIVDDRVYKSIERQPHMAQGLAALATVNDSMNHQANTMANCHRPPKLSVPKLASESVDRAIKAGGYDWTKQTTLTNTSHPAQAPHITAEQLKSMMDKKEKGHSIQ